MQKRLALSWLPNGTGGSSAKHTKTDLCMESLLDMCAVLSELSFEGWQTPYGTRTKRLKLSNKFKTIKMQQIIRFIGVLYHPSAGK